MPIRVAHRLLALGAPGGLLVDPASANPGRGGLQGLHVEGFPLPLHRLTQREGARDCRPCRQASEAWHAARRRHTSRTLAGAGAARELALLHTVRARVGAGRRRTFPSCPSSRPSSSSTRSCSRSSRSITCPGGCGQCCCGGGSSGNKDQPRNSRGTGLWRPTDGACSSTAGKTHRHGMPAQLRRAFPAATPRNQVSRSSPWVGGMAPTWLAAHAQPGSCSPAENPILQ